jgi:fucose permease
MANSQSEVSQERRLKVGPWRLESPAAAITLGYFALFFTLGVGAALVGPTLPELAANTRAQLSAISIIFSTRALGGLIGSFRGGRLYDRLPGHRVIAVMLLVLGSGMALVPALHQLWLLAGLLFLVGVAEGTLHVGGNTLLLWTHRQGAAPYLNGLHLFFGVGAFLGPALIALLLTLGAGIDGAYWSVAILSLPVAWYLLRWPSPAAPVSSQDAAGGQADRRLLLLICLFFFLYVGSEVSFSSWIYTYAVDQQLATVATAAYLTSVFWGTITIGRLVSIPLTLRWRPRRILLVDLLGALASLLVILVGGSSIAVWLGTAGFGLSVASVFPTTMALAGRRMPVSGRATGWFFVGASLGGMILPWVVGQLFEPLGAQAMIVLVMVGMAAALAVLVVLARQPVQDTSPARPREPSTG